jgi:tetratricopeptide (TPR) repeat protein
MDAEWLGNAWRTLVEAAEPLGRALAELAALAGAAPDALVLALVAAGAALLGTLVGAGLVRRQAAPKATPPAEPATPAPEKPEQKENPALRNYQRILEEKGVPAKDQDAHMREFAGQLKDMREKLSALAPADPGLSSLVEEARRALGDGEFAKVVDGLNAVGDREAAAGFELKKTAERHLATASQAKVVAGDLMMAQLVYAEAADAYRQALEALPPGNDEPLAEYLNKHGTAAYQAGDLDAAAASFEQALEMLEARLGETHPDVATALNNLALLHYTRGDFQAAEPVYRRALAIDEQALGPEHPGVATDLNNLALLYKKQGNLAAAEPLLKRALAIKEKNFGPGHPSLVTGLRNYASVLRALDRGEEAAKLEARAAALPPKRRPQIAGA